MKKILIVNNNLHIGGVQKALISLLWNIRDRYDITLLLFHQSGEYTDQLPPEVKVITPSSGYRYMGMPQQDAATQKDLLVRNLYAGITRLLGRKLAVFLMGLGQKTIGEYDVAISYLHNSGDKSFYGGCNDFVLNHVYAKKKVAVLHCDYTLSGGNTPNNNHQYARFDTIAACSQGVADAFLKVNPNLVDKVVVVPNCHRFDQIRMQAQAEPVELPRDRINVVTVARLGREKGVERAVRVMARLGEEKKKLHYYIIGDGIQRETIRQIIGREKLKDRVTLLGTLENPYGYIRAADLLWIPSYSEAAPLVIGEAACLGTPILSTETSSARGMIEDTGYGWVCGNSEESMLRSLKMIVSDRSVLEEKQGVLAEMAWSNDAALTNFADLL